MAGGELGTDTTPPSSGGCRALAGFDSSSSLGVTDELVESPSPHAPSSARQSSARHPAFGAR